MTEKEIISHFQVRIVDFDGELIPDELGHKDHTRSEYQNARLRCENEADRNMIHHLVKDALESLDDPTEFDYLKFMSYYNLKTMTNEIMVKEEYQTLIG